jgi:hypothetical protein
MRVINFTPKFAVGKNIVTIKEFKDGFKHICVGDKGIVDKITIESFPDLNLYNLRILHMDFGNNQLSMGEEIAYKYFKVI